MNSYFPILKTTDAEIRAYEMLEDDVKKHIIPIFELTKSRTTKLSPNGDVEKKLNQIIKLMSGESFILDLTSHEGMTNYQIEGFLDSSDGFKNWNDFLVKHKVDGLIPSVHLDIYDIDQSVRLAQNLLRTFEKLSIRFELKAIDGEYLGVDEMRVCLDALSKIDSVLGKFIIIFDAGFIKSDDKGLYNSEVILKLLQSALKLVRPHYSPDSLVVTTSSFPKSLPGHTKDCGDAYGRFLALEESVYDRFSSYQISHGDYASIHPVRYATGGNGWVPRIDIYCENAHFFYHRVRREKGGYIAAANLVYDDPEFDLPACWGFKQIVAATLGIPNGKSPSFWIAVRANIYMTRIVNKLFII